LLIGVIIAGVGIGVGIGLFWAFISDLIIDYLNKKDKEKLHNT